MIRYHDEIQTQTATYSIDKLKICFTLCDTVIQMLCSDELALLQYLSSCIGLEDYVVRRTSRTFKYRGKYGYKTTLEVHIRYDENSGSNQCFLECNPNKAFHDKRCLLDIQYLLSNSSQFSVKSYDIAVDIPVQRKLVTLRKDRRAMITHFASAVAGTVYLGKERNAIGRVKLYDKQKESKLLSPMTRVEITLGNPLSENWEAELLKALPKVYIRRFDQIPDFQGEKLSSTDMVLIHALYQCQNKFDLMRQLDFKKKRKLSPYILCNETCFDFDTAIMRQLSLNLLRMIETKEAIIYGDEYVNFDNLDI